MVGVLYEDRFTPEAVDYYENWDPRTLVEHLDKWYSYDCSRFGFYMATLLVGVIGVLYLLALQIVLVCLMG